jgi:hypothetical protein
MYGLGGEGYLIASLVPAALLSLVQELITATEELHRRSESLQSISRRLHDTEMQLASAAAERDSLRSLMGRTSTAALAAVSAVTGRTALSTAFARSPMTHCVTLVIPATTTSFQVLSTSCMLLSFLQSSLIFTPSPLVQTAHGYTVHSGAESTADSGSVDGRGASSLVIYQGAGCVPTGRRALGASCVSPDPHTRFGCRCLCACLCARARVCIRVGMCYMPCQARGGLAIRVQPASR